MTEVRFRSDVTAQLVKHAAADGDVIWAARVSTMGERSIEELSKDPERSQGLIRYLMKNRHGTPFEHSSMTFLVQAPIFVFREFHRHRVGWSYSEASGRYRELEPVFYVPALARKLAQQGKPGHYEFVPGTLEQHELTEAAVKDVCQTAYEAYEKMLKAGVAREVARIVLPVGTYSAMYATCNARSLMSFLSLRTHDETAAFKSYPQREIEMVAENLEYEWAKLMPLTYAAFNEMGRVAP